MGPAPPDADRIRPQLGDRFLMDYHPRPLEGGALLLPYAKRPPPASPKSVPLAAPQRSRPLGAGNGTEGALCLQHGAPLCTWCISLGWVHSGHAPPLRSRRREGGLLRPSGERALRTSTSIHICATAAARQGKHRRDLVPCGLSLLAAVHTQAGGL